MPKKKKILIIIISAILVVALGFGIFYLVSPRTFLQLFMSDTTYAVSVVSKNVAKAYENIDAVEATGNLSTDISISSLKNIDSFDAINDYIGTLDINANVYIDEGKVKGIADISDADGSVITAEMISANKKTYLNIDQFGLGWLDMSKTETETTNSGSESESTSEPVELADLISVKGESISIYFTVDQLKQGVADDFIPEEYKDKFESAISSFVSGLSTYGIETVDIQIFVDNRNNIEDIKVILNGPNSDMTIEATIGDGDCYTEIYTNSQEYGKVDMNLTIKPCGFKSFEVPTNTTKFDKNTLKSTALTYVTTTLPEEHPAFKEVYSSVFSSLISNTISQLFGDLLGGNSSSSLTGDSSSTVSSLVEGFLSAFTNTAKE